MQASPSSTVRQAARSGFAEFSKEKSFQTGFGCIPATFVWLGDLGFHLEVVAAVAACRHLHVQRFGDHSTSFAENTSQSM